MDNGRRPALPETLLAAGVFASGLLLFHAPGSSDVRGFWLPWMDAVRENGFVTGYALPSSEYPPLCSVLLYLAGALGARLFPGQDEQFLGLKLLLFAFWLAAAGAYWFLAGHRKYRLGEAALVAACLMVPSVALGYLDILFIPTLLLAVACLRRGTLADHGTLSRTWLALFAVCYALTFLIKWLPILTVPFAVVFFLKRARDAAGGRDDARVVFWVMGVVCAFVFAIYGVPVALSLYRAGHHIALSAQAFNLNWILQHALVRWNAGAYHFVDTAPPGWDFHLAIREEGGEGWILYGPGAPIATLARVMFATHYLWCLWRYWLRGRTLSDLLLYALLGILSYFTLSLGVHENHLFLGVTLAFALAAIEPRFRPVVLPWVVLANLNVVTFYGLTGTGLGFSRIVGGIDATLLLAALEAAAFYALLVTVTLRQRTPAAERGPGWSISRVV